MPISEKQHFFGVDFSGPPAEPDVEKPKHAPMFEAFLAVIRERRTGESRKRRKSAESSKRHRTRDTLYTKAELRARLLHAALSHATGDKALEQIRGQERRGERKIAQLVLTWAARERLRKSMKAEPSLAQLAAEFNTIKSDRLPMLTKDAMRQRLASVFDLERPGCIWHKPKWPSGVSPCGCSRPGQGDTAKTP
jgi:hypothetical protein